MAMILGSFSRYSANHCDNSHGQLVKSQAFTLQAWWNKQLFSLNCPSDGLHIPSQPTHRSVIGQYVQQQLPFLLGCRQIISSGHRAPNVFPNHLWLRSPYCKCLQTFPPDTQGRQQSAGVCTPSNKAYRYIIMFPAYRHSSFSKKYQFSVFPPQPHLHQGRKLVELNEVNAQKKEKGR